MQWNLYVWQQLLDSDLFPTVTAEVATPAPSEHTPASANLRVKLTRLRHAAGDITFSESSRIDERRFPVIGRFACSQVAAAAAEQCEADRKYAVAHSSWVGPSAGEEEEEELQVWQQENRRPRPCRKWWQAGTNAAVPHWWR